MNIKFGRDGKDIGEYPEEAVPALIQSKVLHGSDLFWHDGMPEWKEVATRWQSASVPPAVPANTDDRYRAELRAALAEGWVLLSEGPSGAQLELPRRMKTQTKIALVLGFLLVLAWGFGLIIVAAALIDYALQKKETKFIAR